MAAFTEIKLLKALRLFSSLFVSQGSGDKLGELKTIGDDCAGVFDCFVGVMVLNGCFVRGSNMTTG